MAEAVVMPQMGYDMEKGTVVAWLKREGDTVSQHEAIVEIETDKAVVEIEAPVSGSLLRMASLTGSPCPPVKPLGTSARRESRFPKQPLNRHEQPPRQWPLPPRLSPRRVVRRKWGHATSPRLSPEG